MSSHSVKLIIIIDPLENTPHAILKEIEFIPKNQTTDGELKDHQEVKKGSSK
jgi:hypothetical protein